MYWREVFQTPAHAAKALTAHQTGRRTLIPSHLHAAHVAVRSLGALTEHLHLGNEFSTGLTEGQKMGLCSLGGLKKDIKKALKSTDVAKIQKALTAEQKKIDKAPDSKKAPKRLDYVNQLQAQLVKAQMTPTTAVLPNAPQQPIPQLPATSDPLTFSQGGGGNSTSMMTPEPQMAPAPLEEATGLSLPVMIGIGVAALLGLYLLTRKH